MRPEMWTEPWYRALIENANDDAGELVRIASFIRASSKLPEAESDRLLDKIHEYLPHAEPARPPRDKNEAAIWANAAHSIHDTTAYDDGETELIFIGRRRPSRITEQHRALAAGNPVRATWRPWDPVTRGPARRHDRQPNWRWS